MEEADGGDPRMLLGAEIRGVAIVPEGRPAVKRSNGVQILPHKENCASKVQHPPTRCKWIARAFRRRT